MIDVRRATPADAAVLGRLLWDFNTEVDTDTRRFYERHGFVNIEAGEDYRMLCCIGPTG